MDVELGNGGATASIANCKSRSAMSSPAILCGCRFGIGSLAELKLGVVGDAGDAALLGSLSGPAGMIPGGGGGSHGAGWLKAFSSCPSPHPMSTTYVFPNKLDPEQRGGRRTHVHYPLPAHDVEHPYLALEIQRRMECDFELMVSVFFENGVAAGHGGRKLKSKVDGGSGEPSLEASSWNTVEFDFEMLLLFTSGV